MFGIDIYNNAHKELGYVYIIIFTCILLLIYSFLLAKKEERKRIIIIYVVLFFLVISGFVFANFSVGYCLLNFSISSFVTLQLFDVKIITSTFLFFLVSISNML